MSSHVLSLNPSDAPWAAFMLMKKKHIRHLPVMEDKKLLDIVSDRDVCRSLFCDKVEMLADGDALIRLDHPTHLRVIMKRDSIKT